MPILVGMGLCTPPWDDKFLCLFGGIMHEGFSTTMGAIVCTDWGEIWREVVDFSTPVAWVGA